MCILENKAMTNQFSEISQGIYTVLEMWESKLQELPQNVITERRNSQNRNIKQILGHLVDSATNNTHRIIHLQNLPSPLLFPNYASMGNNDRWIAIQNYENESWNDLIQLWKYCNRHLAHILSNVDTSKLENVWLAGKGEEVSLKEMILGYQNHLQLHMNEIQELIDLK